MDTNMNILTCICKYEHEYTYLSHTDLNNLENLVHFKYFGPLGNL